MYEYEPTPKRKKSNDFAKSCLIILGLIALVAILCLLGAAIAMWLWNVIMVPLFGMPVLGYWQMYGIIILARLIFGSRISSSNSK